MQKIQRSAQVPFTCEQMYALVERVEDYPAFLPSCSATRVLKRTEVELEAEIAIAKGPISQRFVTRNALKPPFEMTMELIKGPFTQLKGLWRFTEEASGCRVDFQLGYKLGNPLLRMTLGPLFEQVAGGQVDAFVKRAKQVYGG
jgi:ribosome-associated toxin RatA of RatAB toxin-antitoxin module